jgi:CheY-like chemotaxis protein
MAARGEEFRIPGLDVAVYADADDAAGVCEASQPEVVFMDYSFGSGHKDGATAIRALRANGFGGRIIGISSDPVSNRDMRDAGADDSLAKKAHLRSYLVHIASGRKGGGGGG